MRIYPVGIQRECSWRLRFETAETGYVDVQVFVMDTDGREVIVGSKIIELDGSETIELGNPGRALAEKVHGDVD